MNTEKRESMCVVDYVAGSSEIHEFMTEGKYNELLKQQKRGMVRIISHENLSV